MKRASGVINVIALLVVFIAMFSQTTRAAKVVNSGFDGVNFGTASNGDAVVTPIVDDNGDIWTSVGGQFWNDYVATGKAIYLNDAETLTVQFAETVSVVNRVAFKTRNFNGNGNYDIAIEISDDGAGWSPAGSVNSFVSDNATASHDVGIGLFSKFIRFTATHVAGEDAGVMLDDVVVDGLEPSDAVPNENFDAATVGSAVEVSGTKINSVVYGGYTTDEAISSEIGTGISSGGVGGNYIATALEAETRENGGGTNGTPTWGPDGNPDVPVTNVKVYLPPNFYVTSVSLDIGKSTSNWMRILVQYSDDEGATWKNLQDVKYLQNATNLSFSDTTSLTGVDFIRVNLWRQGGNDPGIIAVDNIVVTGVDDNVIVLNGTDSYISVPHNDAFNTGRTDYNYNTKNQAMALAVWLKTTATSGTIINREVGTGNKSGYYAKLNVDGTVEVKFKGWNSPNIQSTTVVNDGFWHHLAIVAKGRLISLYVDGVAEVDEVDNDVDDGWDVIAPIRIGANQSGADLFAGELNDFRVYQAIDVNTPSNITTFDVAAIIQDRDGSHSITNQNMLLRLAFDGNLVNGGTLGSVADGAATGFISYNSIFEAVDDAYSFSSTVVGNVKDNDLSADTADAILVSGPVHHDGTFVLNADGSFTYTKKAAITYATTDSFTYKIREGTTEAGPVTVSLELLGLVHRYRFNENSGGSIADGGGTADGVATDATWFEEGIEGDALSFNGTSTKIELGSAAALGGSTDFTVSAWIKTVATSAGIIVSQRDETAGGWQGQYQFRVDADGTLAFYIYNGGNQFNFNTTATVNNDAWHHVVALREGVNGRIYIDGVEAGVASGTSVKLLNSAIKVSVGVDLRSGGSYFNGLMDDVRIYNYALSLEEIVDLLNLTPAIGLELVQEGNLLSWSVGDEIDVKEYVIIDLATETIIDIVQAGGGPYSYELPDDLAVKLVVVDNSGVSQTYIPDDGNITSVIYDLFEGWNLIALPGDNADLEDLKDVIVGEIWGWNGRSYEIEHHPTACQGVWVYAPTAKQVVVTCEKSEAEITLQTGWNLVGPKENIVVPESAEVVYSWNSIYQKILKDSETLVRGVGYWILKK